MTDTLQKIESPGSWLKLLGAVAVVFVFFQVLGDFWKSDRGQAGLPIAILIVAGICVFEIWFFRTPATSVLRELGLGVPRQRGIIAASVAGLGLIALFPIYSVVTGTETSLYPDWYWLLPGLFAQSGIAEETLFRGFLFRRLRYDRTFWKAATLSTIPFAIVHLYMFVTLPWPIATAGLLLSIAITFPLAYLFEMGGDTIWAPAILHFVVQGAIKVITVSDDGSSLFPLIWMAACLVFPFLAFLVP